MMNKKKVLVLGSGGMLGHVVYTFLDELNKYELFNSSYPKLFNSQSILLDATNSLEVEKVISEIRPNVLINCIGVLIKGSQSDPANAIYLNSFLPHQLSKLQRRYGGKLITSVPTAFSQVRKAVTKKTTSGMLMIYMEQAKA